MNRKHTNLLFYICLSSLAIFIYYNEILTSPIIDQEVFYLSCDSLLDYLKYPAPVLLIDHEILEQIDRSHCHLQNDKPVKIGIDVSYEPRLSDHRFHLAYFKNSSSADFLNFGIHHKKKLIPKNYPSRVLGNIQVPTDIQKFLGFWQRSSFIACSNPNNQKNISETAVTALASMREELINHGIFPFLTGTTLLEWYKECTIPAGKLNLAVMATEFSRNVLTELESGINGWKVVGTTGNATKILYSPITTLGALPASMDIYFGLHVLRRLVWRKNLGRIGRRTLYNYSSNFYQTII
ncbi:Protein CBG15246 [Caenorhabditis briggsae]|uniref:Protein CBG15246 n=1 Tax=Caenorhabditis briggsae TaxID=6238 RepID=A8XLK8_CAEBR|nr:Protein CBG15246 [Caenorhabditis briggsae]CAP33512.2 Protein CBG15246 [Caenorhabditis briggsae]